MTTSTSSTTTVAWATSSPRLFTRSVTVGASRDHTWPSYTTGHDGDNYTNNSVSRHIFVLDILISSNSHEGHCFRIFGFYI